MFRKKNTHATSFLSLKNNVHQNLRSAYRKLILVEIIDMIVKDERLTVNSTRQPEMFQNTAKTFLLLSLLLLGLPRPGNDGIYVP